MMDVYDAVASRRAVRRFTDKPVPKEMLERFGATAALFCYMDRDMGAAQWADLGMYLQTIVLLLPRGRTSQLSADGVVRVPPQRRRSCVAAEQSHIVLWHVDRIRGHQCESCAHRARPAGRDCQVPRLRTNAAVNRFGARCQSIRLGHYA